MNFHMNFRVMVFITLACLSATASGQNFAHANVSQKATSRTKACVVHMDRLLVRLWELSQFPEDGDYPAAYLALRQFHTLATVGDWGTPEDLKSAEEQVRIAERNIAKEKREPSYWPDSANEAGTRDWIRLLTSGRAQGMNNIDWELISTNMRLYFSARKMQNVTDLVYAGNLRYWTCIAESAR